MALNWCTFIPSNVMHLVSGHLWTYWSWDRPPTWQRFLLMGSTDLMDFWSHFTKFLSFHGLWQTTHFLSISGQTWWKYSLGVPQAWLTFGHTSLNFHPILAFDWPYTFHAFWTNLLELSLGDPQIWLTFGHTLLNFHLPLIDLKFYGNINYSNSYIWLTFSCASLHSWPLINLAFSCNSGPTALQQKASTDALFVSDLNVMKTMS